MPNSFRTPFLIQKKDDETATPSKRFSPFWDYIILAIYSLAFIIIYCSFFDKGEYNEWIVLILAWGAIALLKYSFHTITGICSLGFMLVSMIMFLFGNNFLIVNTLGSDRIIFGQLIGKPDNYYEQYYKDENGNDRLYKGEFATFGRGGRRWHGKGSTYQKFTTTRIYEENGKRMQEKKSVYKMRFSGTWKRSKREGIGTSYWYDKNGVITDKHTGMHVNDIREGQGTYYWFTGGKCYNIYKGNNHNDKRHGYGTMYEVINGDTTKLRPEYSGQWKEGNRDGKGIYYWYQNKDSSCSDIYKGEYQNDQRTGLGTMYRVIDGDTTQLCPIYSGQWKNGEYHGHGKLYDYYGKKIIYEGEFKNGKRVK